MTFTRTHFLAMRLAAPSGAATSASGQVLVEVWKDPNCGCCKDRMKHLQDHGFAVRAFDTGNTAMRAKLGIPATLDSCHTTRVGGYAIEGHVPAREILRLLKEQTVAVGLAVPRTPVGSPGMDGPAYANRRDPYDVVLAHAGGSIQVFQSYH